MSLQKQTIKREITMNKKIAFFCLFSIHTLFYVATFNKAQADLIPPKSQGTVNFLTIFKPRMLSACIKIK